ncbi:MAG: lysyl-tRNA synthetase (class II) [Parcubacteria group bacterium Gr01-1014_18]|nr:MAG: lysyl-tRNA synthetase (class II) [Parcubacteria group bacterium Greene0416_36]TSC81517.1 MAG: lysyl-tRNA synthetase (class II) [Parcubacteria group bacterium Gr01-1014_18]TSC99672.1 MAG: lysyl-tRNA synthetase (class II) [Parcubacteria group bacterium Greene1014_20]TSD07123.1 MAG: lysyl-tRNA synthetase (class II) [Parcubacteria group bacterium Greene0714_2]
MNPINDERAVRISRVEEWRKIGVNPYPSLSKRSYKNSEALAQFEALFASGEKLSLVGRIRLARPHGGSTFMHIEDETSSIQVYFKKDTVGEESYGRLKLLDVGDFINVTGTLLKTHKGEITLNVESWDLLSKSLRPLPDKWHGLKDEEERYRRRYVDLIMNKEVRDLFRKQSEFIRAFREFYWSRGFMEVKTPVLENIPGGAEANPFITHHDTLDIDLYLRISLELHLKRLTVGGFEKIFEIGPVFRNEGMSTQHLQEFTMLESYEAYRDYNYLINFVEELYYTSIVRIFGTDQIKYKDTVLDFKNPWPKVDYYQVVLDHSGIDLSKHLDVDSLKAAIIEKKVPIKLEKHAGLGRVIDQLYKKTVRPHLLQPCMLVNHPLAISPLAKNHEKMPFKVERMQVLIAGAEVGNGFSELNDPIDQRNRFLEQSGLREAGDAEAQMMDEDFVEALEYGMPPTAGFGVGIERLYMICSNSESIRDTVFFPTMKPLV